VCVSCSAPPIVSVVSVLFRLTPVTGVITVTAQVAVWLPSFVLTVIVALPEAMAVTRPLLTVATALLLVSHVTF